MARASFREQADRRAGCSSAKRRRTCERAAPTTVSQRPRQYPRPSDQTGAWPRRTRPANRRSPASAPPARCLPVAPRTRQLHRTPSDRPCANCPEGCETRGAGWSARPSPLVPRARLRRPAIRSAPLRGLRREISRASPRLRPPAGPPRLPLQRAQHGLQLQALTHEQRLARVSIPARRAALTRAHRWAPSLHPAQQTCRAPSPGAVRQAPRRTRTTFWRAHAGNSACRSENPSHPGYCPAFRRCPPRLRIARQSGQRGNSPRCHACARPPAKPDPAPTRRTRRASAPTGWALRAEERDPTGCGKTDRATSRPAPACCAIRPPRCPWSGGH